VIDSSAGAAILEFPDPSTLVPTLTVAQDGSIVSVTYESPDTVDNFALSPDGEQTITYTMDQSIDSGSGVENVRLAVWDAKTGKYISEVRFSAVSIQVMKFSLDGSLLAIGNSSEVWVWDTESWQLLKRFSGHNDLIEDLAFTPDGTKILSASRDGTIRVWSLEG
jgi:WD40 repeat protein